MSDVIQIKQTTIKNVLHCYFSFPSVFSLQFLTCLHSVNRFFFAILPFLIWQFLFKNVFHFSLVLHFPLTPPPVSKSYLISCSFHLYLLVAVFSCSFVLLLLFFPAHFQEPVLSLSSLPNGLYLNLKFLIPTCCLKQICPHTDQQRCSRY